MNLNDIYEIMEKFENSSLTSFELDVEDFSLKLGKGAVTTGVSVVPAPVSSVASAAPAEPTVSTETGDFVKSPLVGTYYKASAPDSEPFVTVGKTVKKGDTVCLVEAMKMINEIPAPYDCVIEKILVEDGCLVEFEQPLFLVKQG